MITTILADDEVLARQDRINVWALPWSYLVIIGTGSTFSVELKRTSEDLPVLMLRRVAWTNARRLPGVRC